MATVPPKPPRSGAPFVPRSDDEPAVRAALEERAAGRALTPEELKRWAETGEWPESHG